MVESQADDQVTSGLEHSVATDEAADLKSIFNLAFPTNTLNWRHAICSNVIYTSEVCSRDVRFKVCSNTISFRILPDTICSNDIFMMAALVVMTIT